MHPNPSDDPHSAGLQSARNRRPDVFVVSSDDSFLLELGPALGDRFRTHPVDQIADITFEGDGQRFVFIDGARDDARTLLGSAERQFPDLPMIMVASDGTEAQWHGALTRGSICAVVARSQIAGPPLMEAIVAAERRLQVKAAPAGTASGGDSTAGGKPGIRLIAIGAAVLAVVAVGGWLIFRGDGTTVNTPTTAAVASNSAAKPPSVVVPTPQVPERTVLELLSAARVAFQNQDNLLPPADGGRGDSALELYSQVLRQDPQNEEARDGLRRLFSVARSRIQNDLAAGRLEEAQRMLTVFKSAGLEPDSTRALENDIAAARPRWLLSQARRAVASGDWATVEQLLPQLPATGPDRSVAQELRRALDAHQVDLQLGGMADEVRAAIAAGNLLEPAATSARTRLLAMRQQSRNHAVTAAAQRDLQSALLARARELQRQQQLDGAQKLLVAAAEFGSNQEVTDARKQLQAEQDQLTARVTAAPVAPAVEAPPPVVASPRPPTFVTAKPTRPLNVAYPPKAADSKQQGYVVVEFTLAADGRATNPSVVESQPATVFDKAAVDAVSRGRFDTAVLGESKLPQRARLKVSFKPT